jgi:DnaA family protein
VEWLAASRIEYGAVRRGKVRRSTILPDKRELLRSDALAPDFAATHVTEQLVFDLAAPQPPSFDNFLPSANAEALAALRALSAGMASETGVLLWGAPGAGKTHLLRAAVAAAAAHGRSAIHIADANSAPEFGALAHHSLVAVDDIDLTGPGAQASLITLYNALRDGGGHLLVASRSPLAALMLREDLRTRLGWGLVYEITPLSDIDKPAALTALARGRGFRLADDVIDYLLAHGRRDMPALIDALAALDRHSLATKRPITVAMLKSWLQRDFDLNR